MQTTLIDIEGMRCAGCAASVESSIGRVPGVARVTVDLAGKNAAVEAAERPGILDEIRKAVEDAGFRVAGPPGAPGR